MTSTGVKNKDTQETTGYLFVGSNDLKTNKGKFNN